MVTDQEQQAFQSALTGGWSLTRSHAFALGLLRAADVLRERRELDKSLTSELPFYSIMEDQKSAISLLQDAGFAYKESEAYYFDFGISASRITEKGWSMAAGLTALNMPAHISWASRELLLHALYQAGETGLVLRNAYFGQSISKSSARYVCPLFEPWIIFAGD